MVNETFVSQYFGSENAVGRTFEVVSNEGRRVRYEIVGVVGDERYRNMREAMQPTAYFPFRGRYGRATFVVRTSNRNPLVMEPLLRRQVPQARAGFHAGNIVTQTLIEQHTARDGATCSLCSSGGGVVLAGVGLYGVLDYSVLQRRREIGIRIAIGAQAGDIAQSVTLEAFTMVLAGCYRGSLSGWDRRAISKSL